MKTLFATPPRSVVCPTCWADVGEPCIKDDLTYRLTPHRQRILEYRGERSIEQELWDNKLMRDFEADWSKEQQEIAERNLKLTATIRHDERPRRTLSIGGPK